MRFFCSVAQSSFFFGCNSSDHSSSSESVIITFDANGAQNPQTKKTQVKKSFAVGQTKQITLPGISELGFVKDGYVFNGWSDSQDSSEVKYEDKGDFTAEEDCTLYALWILQPDPMNPSDSEEPLSEPYTFHEKPVRLPSGTNGTAGYNAVYVYFGDFPQTIKDDSVTITETTVIHGPYTYYLGDDNYYYLKAEEKAYGSQYKYSDGTEAEGSSRYFKVMPIKWRLLSSDEDGLMFLLAESALISGIPFSSVAEQRSVTVSDKKSVSVAPNNWKYSAVRAYLNGAYESNDDLNSAYSEKGFLQSAFTESAKSLIKTTDTSDSIFLLSYEEATSSNFKSAASKGLSTFRIRIATDFAIASSARLWNNNGAVWWFLRSPYGTAGTNCRVVAETGAANTCPFATHSYIGIVPALYVKSE